MSWGEFGEMSDRVVHRRPGHEDSDCTVLVTGAAGFIGSHVCRALLRQGHTVIGVDRLVGSYDVPMKLRNLSTLTGRFLFHRMDVRDPAMAALVSQSDVLIHLAGRPGVRESWGDDFDLYVEDNILATHRLLEAAAEARLRKFVFASSSSVYGNGNGRPSKETDEPAPISPYGVTKLAAERLCLAYEAQYGTPTMSLRFFTVYGPAQRPDMAISRFIDRIGRGETVPLYNAGSPVRELTFVDDVVEAVLGAAFSPVSGCVVNVGGGSIVTVREMAEIVAEQLGKPLLADMRPAGAGDATQTWCDHTRARKLLDYSPSTDLRTGISAQIEASLDPDARPVELRQPAIQNEIGARSG